MLGNEGWKEKIYKVGTPPTPGSGENAFRLEHGVSREGTLSRNRSIAGCANPSVSPSKTTNRSYNGSVRYREGAIVSPHLVITGSAPLPCGRITKNTFPVTAPQFPHPPLHMLCCQLLCVLCSRGIGRWEFKLGVGESGRDGVHEIMSYGNSIFVSVCGRTTPVITGAGDKSNGAG